MYKHHAIADDKLLPRRGLAFLAAMIWAGHIVLYLALFVYIYAGMHSFTQPNCDTRVRPFHIICCALSFSFLAISLLFWLPFYTAIKRKRRASSLSM